MIASHPVRSVLIVAASLLAAPSAPHAQATWPSRPIRLVVPFAAGGAADSAARAITPKMGERLGGATFVVENRTGASGAVGAAAAVRASLRAVALNPGPMLLWGVIVAAVLAVACIPLFVGLAVAVPVLGHATWHLYRALIPR